MLSSMFSTMTSITILPFKYTAEQTAVMMLMHERDAINVSFYSFNSAYLKFNYVIDEDFFLF